MSSHCCLSATDAGLEGIVSKTKTRALYVKSDCIKVKCAQWKEDNKDRGDLFIRRTFFHESLPRKSPQSAE